MTTATLRDVRVIDTDSHVIEPADLWTSRIASKWGDAVPQVAVRPGGSGRARWRVGNAWLHLPGVFGVAGWPEYPPSMPATSMRYSISSEKRWFMALSSGGICRISGWLQAITARLSAKLTMPSTKMITTAMSPE